MSCCADAEINPVTKGKQAIKLGINSELIPCFEKPQNELKSPRSRADVPILFPYEAQTVAADNWALRGDGRIGPHLQVA